MGLCTLAQLKTQLKIGTADTEHDTFLTQLIAGVSAAMARAAGRIYGGGVCLEKSALTVLLSPESRMQTLWLPAWPVVTITEVKEAVFGGFDDVDALVENEDYQVNKWIGGLYRIGFWLAGVNTVRVSVTGGYTAAGATPGTGETALPGDVVNAAIRQVIREFNIRATPGYQAESVQGSSVSWSADDTLLSGVRDICEGLARKG